MRLSEIEVRERLGLKIESGGTAFPCVLWHFNHWTLLWLVGGLKRCLLLNMFHHVWTVGTRYMYAPDAFTSGEIARYKLLYCIVLYCSVAASFSRLWYYRVPASMYSTQWRKNNRVIISRTLSVRLLYCSELNCINLRNRSFQKHISYTILVERK